MVRQLVPDTFPLSGNKHTYLMRHGKTNLYKIGQSAWPERRLEQLRIGNLFIKLVTYGCDASEEQLHILFEDKRIESEWFRLDKDEVDLAIKLIGQPERRKENG